MHTLAERFEAVAALAWSALDEALLARDGVCVLCAEEPARCEGDPTTSSRGPNPAKAPPSSIDNLALLCGTSTAPVTSNSSNPHSARVTSPTVACTTTNAPLPGALTASGTPHPTPATPAGGDTPAPTTPTPPQDRAPVPEPAERWPPDSGLHGNDRRQQIRCPDRLRQVRAGTPGDGAGAISPDAPPTATGGPARGTPPAGEGCPRPGDTKGQVAGPSRQLHATEGGDARRRRQRDFARRAADSHRRPRDRDRSRRCERLRATHRGRSAGIALTAKSSPRSPHRRRGHTSPK